MILRITEYQTEQVHGLGRRCCANCDEGGNCLLPDDGEEQKCMQLLCAIGLSHGYGNMKTVNYPTLERCVFSKEKIVERISKYKNGNHTSIKLFKYFN